MDLDVVREASLGLLDLLNEAKDSSERRRLLKAFVEEGVSNEVLPLDLLLDVSHNSLLNVSEEGLDAKHLRNRVVLLDFFTYCCINCLHVLPHLRKLEETTDSSKLIVVGVHSAKFDNERKDEHVLDALKRYDVNHVVVNDKNNMLWNRFGIICWPTLLLFHPLTMRPLFILEGENNFDILESIVQLLIETSMNDLHNKHPIPFVKGGNVKSSSKALLSYPGKVSVYENICCLSDTGHNRLIIFDLYTQDILYIIGSGEKGFEDGHFSSACFNSPQGSAFLNTKQIYVADTDNHAIRMIDLEDSRVTTIISAFVKTEDTSESEEVATKLVKGICSPWDVCVATMKSGTVLFVAMAGNHQLWSVLLEGSFNGDDISKTSRCVAGNGVEGNKNNLYALKASLAQPSGIDFECNKIFFADSESSTIRCLMINDEEDSKNAISGVKGVVGGGFDPNDLFAFGDKDGKGNDAKLQHPMGVCVVNMRTSGIGKTTKLVVADSFNHKLKVVEDLEKKKATIRTMKLKWDDDEEDQGLNEPGGLAWIQGNEEVHDDSRTDSFTLLVADTNNHRVVKVKDNHCTVLRLKKKVKKEKDEELKFDHIVQQRLTIGKGNKDIVLKFDLRLPSTLTLNVDAPNKWALLNDNGAPIPKPMKAELMEPLRLSSEILVNNKANLELVLIFYVCDDVKGTCETRTAKVQVELTVDKEANEASGIVDLAINIDQ